MTSTDRPLVLHVIHRLAMGGLENGLTNLINHMPETAFRHAIACIESSTEFRARLARRDVEIVELERSKRGLWRVRRELFSLCRRLRPAILHSRNLSGLDALLPGALAGARVRIHGEHGWDMADLHGEKLKPALLRRIHAPLVTHYVTVSEHQRRYLVERLRISPARVTRIYNGVDTARFHPGDRLAARGALPPTLHASPDTFIIGTVGRLQPVKDHGTLLRAFAALIERSADFAARARLLVAGDGPLAADLRTLARTLGIAERTWFAGAVDAVPELLQALDVFVLPSLAEGISNTVLEAMATGLPVVATAAGGTREVVEDGRSGRLFEPRDAATLCTLLAAYASSAELRAAHGARGRELATEKFAIASMVAAYEDLYRRCTRAN